MALRRRGPSLLSPTAYLRANAIRRGVWGGNKPWIVVGVFLYAPRVIRRIIGRNEEVIATEKLLPGQFVRIEALPTPTKAERGAARQATRRAK